MDNYIETVDIKALNELAEEHDKHWDEVMELAKKYGFIVQAFGGTATLISNKNQIINYEYHQYLKIQEMNNSIEDKEKYIR